MDLTEVTGGYFSSCSKYLQCVNICGAHAESGFTKQLRHDDACCGWTRVFLPSSEEYSLIPPTYRKWPFPCCWTHKVHRRFHPLTSHQEIVEKHLAAQTPPEKCHLCQRSETNPLVSDTDGVIVRVVSNVDTFQNEHNCELCFKVHIFIKTILCHKLRVL